MERTRFTDHRGKQILVADFSGVRDKAEALRLIEHARQTIGRQPPKSVRLLTDVTNAHYDPTIVQALKDFAAHNTPFLIASAVVGVTGLRRVVYTGVVAFSRRKIHIADTREAAMEWLVQQE